MPDWLATGEWTLRITGVQELRGIGEGSTVKLNGVDIGRVRELEFIDPNKPDQGVVIITRIKQRYTVHKGAKANIYGATFGIGSGHIDIMIEPAKIHIPLNKEDAEIPGEMRSVIKELISPEMVNSVQTTIANIGHLADAATPLAKNMAEMLGKRSIQDIDTGEEGLMPNVSSVLQRMDKFISNLNTVLDDDNVKDDLKFTLRDLKEITTFMKETLSVWENESKRLSDNLNDGIDQTEKNLDETFVRLNRVLEKLDDTSTSLAAAMQTVSEGKGTAGKFVNDDRLYEAAVLAVERFGEVMINLQVITGKIKEDGYIMVGQAPTGILKKRFDIPLQASDFP